MGSQLLAIVLGFGSYLYVHYYFILFAILPVLFFPMHQWGQVIALFVANAGLFLHFELHRLPPALAILQLNDSVIQTLRAGYATSTFLTMLPFVWLAEIIAERNEQRLAELSVTDALTRLPNRSPLA